MAEKIKAVSVKMHPNFFNNWFEPNRRKYERKLGRSISQVKFTGMVADNWKLKKGRKTYLPKEFRHMKFFT
jgi:hypothetical protein